jgi:DNA (cytosine-5)-methyltransferase 1
LPGATSQARDATPSASEPGVTIRPMSFTFIDLFAGIGGMRLGFEEAGGECVFTSEWNKYARQTYAANFNEHEADIAGDITQIDERDIPDHDVLVAGFPCQPFSIAGVSKKNALGRKHGFEDETQGTLFFDVARILAEKRPKAFLLENVKNLRSHDKGRTLEVIRRVLTEELGYTVSMRVIDAAGFVPQHRERIFIVGTAPGVPPFDLSDVEITAPDSGPRLGAILHPEDGSEEPEAPYTHGPSGRVSDKYTLTPKLWSYLQAYAAKHRAAGNGFGFGLVGRDDIARTMSARYYKDGSEILIAQRGGRPRRLTPREAARLMGFDSSSVHSYFSCAGAQEWIIPVSDTQAYRQFGNAVVPAVVAALAVPLGRRVKEAEQVSSPVLAWPGTPPSAHVEIAA